MLYQAAMIMGFYLGDWEQTGTMIHRARAISGPDPFYQYVVTAAYIMSDNWTAARDRLNVLQETINALEGILVVAVGSHLHDQALIAEGRVILLAKGKDDAASVKQYIDELHYEPAISQLLYTLCRNYYESLSQDSAQ